MKKPKYDSLSKKYRVSLMKMLEYRELVRNETIDECAQLILRKRPLMPYYSPIITKLCLHFYESLMKLKDPSCARRKKTSSKKKYPSVLAMVKDLSGKRFYKKFMAERKKHVHKFDRWCWHHPRKICFRCEQAYYLACKCGKRDKP